MAEVAGVVIGIIPLVLKARATYHAIYEVKGTFSNISCETKHLSAKLEVQKAVFENSCKLLLGIAPDEPEGFSQKWNDEDEDSCSPNYRKTLPICMEVIQCIIIHLEEMRGRIENLTAELGIKKLNNEPIRQTFKRLKLSGKLIFNKDLYEKDISILKGYNEDLITLMDQLGSFRLGNVTCGKFNGTKNLPPHYKAVQAASQTLYDSLQGVWSCAEPSHEEHYAKLCLTAEVGDGVSLHMALSSRRATPPSERHSKEAVDISAWLHVQTTRLSASSRKRIVDDIPTSNPVTSLDDLKIKIQDVCQANHSFHQDIVLPKRVKRQSKLKRFFSYDQVGGQEDRHEQLNNTASVPTQIRYSLHKPTPVLSPSITSLEEAICQRLWAKESQQCECKANHCLGFLQTQSSFKHMFYFPCSTHHSRGKKPFRNSVVPLSELLRHCSKDQVTLYHRSKLARSVVSAFLQYHSTSWWSSHWGLQSISLLGDPRSYVHDDLNSLHLTQQIPSPSIKKSGLISDPQKLAKICARGLNAPRDLTLEEREGIANLTVFDLAVVLSQIGHWQSFESAESPHRHFKGYVQRSRRMSTPQSPLGRKYQRIVDRLMACNFGVEPSLQNQELEQRIYTDVLCELDNVSKHLEELEL
ncbi:hypothetical protein FQN57_002647 [Myotisia sp. PD_48]|nr:hypothetical protein FQN57_002647 [Myotisia sp. PD_48]